MLDFAYKFSNFSIFLLIVAVTTTISLLAIFLNKYFIFYKLRYKDNATIGSISSLIGIIYGVLVGFIALYLIDNNDRASNAAQREANAVANIYRDSLWLKNPFKDDLIQDVEKYLKVTIFKEWPAMNEGKKVDTEGDVIINEISKELSTFTPKTSPENTILGDLITETKELYNARHERINISGAQLSPELWEVILMGTILIIAINYAFRVSFYLHLFAISAFAIMAASMLFLLITLDRPFQGEFMVEANALQSVLDFIQQNK